MPDIEQRLRNVLSAQADTVETDLSGADLRTLAEERVRTRRRTAAQALVAAVVVAVIGLAPQVFTGPERTHRPAPSPIAPGGSVSPLPRQSTPSRAHDRLPRATHRTAMPTPGRPEPTTTPALSATPRNRPVPSRSKVTTRRAPTAGRTPPVAGSTPPAPPRTLRPNATTSS
jgi:hypothetical protein